MTQIAPLTDEQALDAAQAEALAAYRAGDDETLARIGRECGTTLAVMKQSCAEWLKGRSKGARQPRWVPLSSVTPEPVRWLWQERIARGKLTLIVGDPGLGKSFLTLDLASRVSTGCGWPDAPGETFEPGGVVLLSAEDDISDTIRPRLDAAGADCSRIVALEGVQYTDPESKQTMDAMISLRSDVQSIEETIEDTPGCSLVVIDPISAYLGDVDGNDNGKVRGVLSLLSDMAKRTGVAVVAISHLNKGGNGGSVMYRAMGSLAFVAAARAAFAVTKDKDDHTGTRRLFLPIKNNIGNDRHGLAYQLRSLASPNGQPQVHWEAEPVTVSADDALNGERTKPGPAPAERNEAAEWLRDILADGPLAAKELYEQASNAGHSYATVNRAKQPAKVESYKDGMGAWFWRMKPEDTQDRPQRLSN